LKSFRMIIFLPTQAERTLSCRIRRGIPPAGIGCFLK
jgi:hypothetical protein